MHGGSNGHESMECRLSKAVVRNHAPQGRLWATTHHCIHCIEKKYHSVSTLSPSQCQSLSFISLCRNDNNGATGGPRREFNVMKRGQSMACSLFRVSTAWRKWWEETMIARFRRVTLTTAR